MHSLRRTARISASQTLRQARPPQRMHLHTTAALSAGPDSKPDKVNWKGKDPTLSQGHATSEHARGAEAVQHEYARAGLAAHTPTNDHPYDSANPNGVRKAPRGEKEGGNAERVGFAEQVGGASAHAERMESGEGGEGEKGGKEEAKAPGMLGALKQAVGLGTSAGDVKQNRGSGAGVTGTGKYREDKD